MSGPAGPGLRRVLSLRTVISNSAGITFATTTFVAAAQVAGATGGDGAWIAVLVAGLLVALVAACFAELNGMMPTAAAIRVYLQRGYRGDLALAVSAMYMFVIVLVLGAEAYVLAAALHYELPAVPPLAWVLVLLVAALLLNLRGVEIAGVFQDAVTYLVVGSVLALGLLAFWHAGFRLPGLLHPGGASGIAQGAAVAVFLFVGFEWVTPLAEEVTDNALIARGMTGAVVLLTVAYMIATPALGHFVHGAALSGAVPEMVFARDALGAAGAVWMLAVCLGASATTFNSGFTAASRFLYATAREGSAPAGLARVNRHFTPSNALFALFICGVAAAVAVTALGGFRAIIDLGAAMEGAVYALAAGAVIRLRVHQPEAERPFRAPGMPFLAWFTIVVFGILAVLSAVQGGLTAIALLVAGGAASWYYGAVLGPGLRRAAAARRAERRAERVRAVGGPPTA